MELLVVSSAPLIGKKGRLFAYPPYVNEMDLWFEHFEFVSILSPNSYPIDFDLKQIDQSISFIPVPFLQFSDFKRSFQSVIRILPILYSLFTAMHKADHIHLRCPGNISLLGCIVQIFFPKKTKTAKYAGNWDPESKQPWSYRFQKWILSNTFLSRNIKVLSYGNWENQTSNIVPFFTASYSIKEVKTSKRDYSKDLKFIFVGSLSPGKQPFFAIKMVEYLLRNGKNASLNIYGTGILREELQSYIDDSEFSHAFKLEGFSKKEQLKDIYLDSHFLILPSKSEGWPKAVAEAMFFGCIPIATPISCVPWMLANGKRGILIPDDLEIAAETLLEKLSEKPELEKISVRAQEWSQEYTLEKFKKEISKLL